MSAQAGIWFFDGRPITPDLTQVFSRGNETLGPDGRGLYVGNGLVLLSFAAPFDRLSRAERQPLQAPDGSVLTWDGRLDNREDFLVRLQAELDDDLSDAALVARSLARWPQHALAQAMGDWSLVQWSPREMRLLLARDYFGNRPLHYRWCEDYFAWSTAIEPLPRIAGSTGILDELFIAAWLTHNPPEHRTFFRDVLLVPAGHELRVVPGRPPEARRFMELTPTEVRYQSPRQYEDHYRALFTEAVKVRLRADSPVWCELSGGYDSSAITCVAASHVRTRSVDTPELRAVSVIPEGSPESDEGPYIESVERHCALSSARLRSWYRSSNGPPELVPIGTEVCSAAPPRFAARHGARVLLSGIFGDLLTTPMFSEDILIQHLARLRLRTFAADCLAYCRATKQTFWHVLRALPKTYSISKRVSRQELVSLVELVQSDASDLKQLADSYGLRLEFLRRALTSTAPSTGLASHASSTVGRLILGVQVHVTRNLLSAGDSTQALRITFPFVHRPLLEFVMGLPPTVMWSSGHPRAFVLRALGDVLPAAVLGRGSKGDGGPALTRELAPPARAALQNIDRLLLVRLGYADPSSLIRLFSRFVDGTSNDFGIVRHLLSGENLLAHACDLVGPHAS